MREVVGRTKKHRETEWQKKTEKDRQGLLFLLLGGPAAAASIIQMQDTELIQPLVNTAT